MIRTQVNGNVMNGKLHYTCHYEQMGMMGMPIQQRSDFSIKLTQVTGFFEGTRENILHVFRASVYFIENYDLKYFGYWRSTCQDSSMGFLHRLSSSGTLHTLRSLLNEQLA